MNVEELRDHIRNIPDFPIEGVIFKDITTLLTHPGALNDTVKHLEKVCEGFEYDAIAAIESRGFIFGSVMAAKKDLPLVLIRKPGKLPGKTVSEEYSLEYGTNTVEMHKNSLPAGSRVLIVDDLIATGGSAMAAVSLLRQDSCVVAGAAFVVDLSFLGGGNKLQESGISYVKLIEVDSG
ncbi:MAG: adenine phosphoribosyltransferase [Candidatus Aegiribacteria sp.]|nr:adenine phosphoribosyltransferase [Candidatus Aegiribacteria sp.]